MSGSGRISCSEAFRRLDDFVDRELGDDERVLVARHLEDCARCADEFAVEAELLQAIRDKLRRIDAPPDLKAKIAARLSASP